MIKFFGEQRKNVLTWLAHEAARPIRKAAFDQAVELVNEYLPSVMPALVSWTPRLSELVEPIFLAYAQEAAEAFWQRVVGELPNARAPGGSPPDASQEEPRRPLVETGFDVVNPKLRQAVDQLTLTFCEETNQTTSRALADALEATRAAIREGTVEGLAMKELTRRVNEVFDQAETWRAKRIAVTESSRAVHMAEDLSAKESGVVEGFEWLTAGDACDICQPLNGKRVPLGTPFLRGQSKVPEYSDVFYPPAHVNCQCSVIEILTEEETL